jgi:hypothetical protein
MEEKRTFAVPTLMVVGVLLAALVIAYVAGYLSTGETKDDGVNVF